MAVEDYDLKWPRRVATDDENTTRVSRFVDSNLCGSHRGKEKPRSTDREHLIQSHFYSPNSAIRTKNYSPCG